jgi:hypothetical protein
LVVGGGCHTTKPFSRFSPRQARAETAVLIKQDSVCWQQIRPVNIQAKINTLCLNALEASSQNPCYVRIRW